MEKVNPKDFRSISLEVLGSNVIITDGQSQEENSHSTPSILSLGVYSGDKRYFGYIITEVTGTGSSSKQRVQCHVYRAARNSTAANIIDAISASYQSAYSPRTENCELNPIYQSTYATGRRRYTADSSSLIGGGVAKSPDNPVTNPIYSPGYISTRRSGNYDVNGRNSIVSISSNTTNASNVEGMNLSCQSSSTESSPSSTLDNKREKKKKSHQNSNNSHYTLIDRLNLLRTSCSSSGGGNHINNNNSHYRHSMNIECLSEEQKDLLIDFEDDLLNNGIINTTSQQPQASPRTTNTEEFEHLNNSKDKTTDSITGSTDTLLALTPSSPSSPCSLLSTNKKERPKSLYLQNIHGSHFDSISQNEAEVNLVDFFCFLLVS